MNLLFDIFPFTMSNPPTPEEIVTWKKRLASQANNRAWALAEQAQRTADEDEEMLQAAHAASFFWNQVGTPRNHAHAWQLLAHAYALQGIAGPAQHYGDKSFAFFTQNASEPWEMAFVYAIAANVSACAGNKGDHSAHYGKAQMLIVALSDPEDAKILSATLRVVPQPEA